MTDYDTTEKVERTDKGFRLTVESTRGTGTRDQDKVKAELRTEERPSKHATQRVIDKVKACMTDLRSHHPEFEPEESE